MSEMEMLMQILANGGNPQQIVQNLILQNPQVKAIFNQQKQSGLSMEQFARQYAKQKNIDIQPFINMMTKK